MGAGVATSPHSSLRLLLPGQSPFSGRRFRPRPCGPGRFRSRGLPPKVRSTAFAVATPCGFASTFALPRPCGHVRAFAVPQASGRVPFRGSLARRLQCRFADPSREGFRFRPTNPGTRRLRPRRVKLLGKWVRLSAFASASRFFLESFCRPLLSASVPKDFRRFSAVAMAGSLVPFPERRFPATHAKCHDSREAGRAGALWITGIMGINWINSGKDLAARTETEQTPFPM